MLGEVGGRDRFDALVLGGPRNREGRGGRFGLRVGDVAGEVFGDSERGDAMIPKRRLWTMSYLYKSIFRP